MDNQHKHIKGYRDLSKGEIQLMNEIKSLEADVNRRLASASNSYRRIIEEEAAGGRMTSSQYKDRNATHRELFDKATDHLMVGFMLAVRSIAQPQPTETKSIWRSLDVEWNSHIVDGETKLTGHVPGLAMGGYESNQHRQVVVVLNEPESPTVTMTFEELVSNCLTALTDYSNNGTRGRLPYLKFLFVDELKDL